MIDPQDLPPLVVRFPLDCRIHKGINQIACLRHVGTLILRCGDRINQAVRPQHHPTGLVGVPGFQTGINLSEYTILDFHGAQDTSLDN
jgi:hypothetical protein